MARATVSHTGPSATDHTKAAGKLGNTYQRRVHACLLAPINEPSLGTDRSRLYREYKKVEAVDILKTGYLAYKL
jgi:hypothetical protein